MSRLQITMALSGLMLLAAPAAAQAADRLPASLARISVEQFARQVKVVDDPLEHDIVFTTSQAYKVGRSLAGARATDVHLRALVDRQTGAIRWQVWHELVTTQGEMDITDVRFVTGGATRSVAPSIVESWKDRCPAYDNNMTCDNYTRVVVELPEQAIREMAASHVAGSREPWRLRFKDASGRDVTSGLAPAEAAGLLQSVSEWRTRGRQLS